MLGPTACHACTRRYVAAYDPADVQAEMEVTARVRKAAAEALAEANTQLAEAQAAQRALAAQLEEARELSKVSRARCACCLLQ